jgi:hypothetical protein
MHFNGCPNVHTSCRDVCQFVGKTKSKNFGPFIALNFSGPLERCDYDKVLSTCV